MPYVKRDEAGQIVSVSLSREDDDQEFLDAESAQLAAFFEDAGPRRIRCVSPIPTWCGYWKI